MWWDFYKVFTYAFTDDPLSKVNNQQKTGAGVSQPDAIPDIRNSMNGGSGDTSINLRGSTDLIDLTSVSNRQNRYKEYERLRMMPEIEMAMNVFADEACFAGETIIPTPHGNFKLKELAKRTEKFLVYSYDFSKNDYTLAWAYDVRKTKISKTIKIVLDNGHHFICTHDHRILKKNAEWVQAGDLKFGDELMPFYRVEPNTDINKLNTNQFPRIYSQIHGWITERQFIDEWRTGEIPEEIRNANKYCRMISDGLNVRQIGKITGNDFVTVRNRIKKIGFSNAELKWLGNKRKSRRVIATMEHDEIDVYDMSVEKHENFATSWGIAHNCQRDDDGRTMKINVKNDEIKEELEFLFFHRKMLNLDQKNVWNKAKQLFIKGDYFEEIIIDPENPSDGIQGLVPLPPESMFRLQTTQGRLIEFQQSKEGPDYQSLKNFDINHATESDIESCTAIRFTPNQIIHITIGDDRDTFYPYGVSLMETARGPANQLRLMEDAMVVYRLTRSPERRVFYIDVQQLPPYKAEAFLERMKDQFRKKKIPGRNSTSGASSVEERWQAPAADEDYWIPIRANTNTRVETLPGACLALDTKIPLLDGTEDTLSKIIERWNNGEEMWAYSCNPETGQIAPGLVTWAGETRKNAKVVKVTFDNGESLVCTPDHKFPVIGREGKIEAKDLNIGDSLIPFRTRQKKIKKNTRDYIQVYDTFSRSWEFVHRIVAKYKRINRTEMIYDESYREEKKDVIHHKDFNRFNNNPNNLAWMHWRDHLKLHQDAPATEECKIKISEGLKKFHKNLSPQQVKKRNESLKKKSVLGSSKMQKLLSEDKTFRDIFVKAQKDGWKTAAEKNPELHEKRGEKIASKNKERFADPKYKKQVSEKQTIQYPELMFELICKGFSQGFKRDDLIIQINNNQEIVKQYVELNKHIVRDVEFKNGITVDHFDKLIKNKGFSGSRNLRKHLLGKINDRSSQDASSKKMYGNTTLNFPKEIFNYFIHRLADGEKNADIILNEINQNPKLMKIWKSVNSHVKRKNINLDNGIKRTHVRRMIESYGYNNLEHAREEASLYNHTVISVEYLEETQDVGTITIDGNETYHNYHTFAVSGCGVMTYNSNLGEIDDTVYFRNKLFTALNFPKNYFNNEDAQATRISLSAQDVKFARMIERLQSHMEDAYWEIADRHLKLVGYPEESYEDLMIKMTPPSDWRELTRAEVITNRLSNASSIKSAMLMSDYDILTEWLYYSEDDAKAKLARLKIQKLEDLKLQIVAQNPTFLGVGLPGPNEVEVGAQVGGPNPDLQPQDPNMPPQDPNMMQPPGMPPQDPNMMQPPGNAISGMKKFMDSDQENPKAGSGTVLPNPSEDDIRRYDLDIKDYDKEIDEEEQDLSDY